MRALACAGLAITISIASIDVSLAEAKTLVKHLERRTKLLEEELAERDEASH